MGFRVRVWGESLGFIGSRLAGFRVRGKGNGEA